MKEKLESAVIVPSDKEATGAVLGDIVTVTNITRGFTDYYEISGDMESSIEGLTADDVIKLNLNSPIVRAIYGEEVGAIIKFSTGKEVEMLEIDNIRKPKQKQRNK